MDETRSRPDRGPWRRYEDVAAILNESADEEWDADRRLLDDELAVPSR